jgi:capsular exopolysaccharide synthesis family protein
MTTAQDDVVDLKSILSTLWRGKLIIALFFMGAVFMGGYYAYIVAEPSYRSTAVVMLNNREEQVVDLEGVVGGLGSDTSVVNTEVEILRSRSLLGRVVDELALTEDEEFNTRLLPTPAIERLKTFARDLIGMQQPTFDMSPDFQAMRDRETTINSLLSAMSVRNVPQSLVFQITIESSSARKAARIADTVVEVYINNQLAEKSRATQQATDWLSTRVAELQTELERDEQELKTFRSSIDLVNQEVLEGLEVQLKDVRERLLTLTAAREEARERLSALEQADTPLEQIAASSDEQLEQFRARLSEPAIAAAFDTRYAQLLTRTRLETQRLDAQIDALNTSREELEIQINRQNADLIRLQQLTREVAASEELYSFFLNRLKETAAQEGIQQPDSRMLSPAVVPVNAASPRKALILGASGMLGLIFSGIFVLIWEARQNTFRTALDLEHATGKTVLGQIPRLSKRRRAAVVKYLSDKPSSAFAEAVRNLRTSLTMSNLDNPPRTFMVTSAVPSEGKTTLSFALAWNLRSMGKKVLLVEGDIRRFAFTQYMKVAEEDRNLVKVILGEKTLEDSVIKDEVTGADVLMAAKTEMNVADLFAMPEFGDFVKNAREAYDYVVIDTAPVMAVPDARLVGRHVDAVCFTVRWDYTSKSLVTAALSEFETVGVDVTGVVLNQISVKGMRRYGYGDQYGAYATKYYTN